MNIERRQDNQPIETKKGSVLTTLPSLFFATHESRVGSVAFNPNTMFAGPERSLLFDSA